MQSDSVTTLQGASELLAKNTYAAILCDVQLPDAGGPEILDKLGNIPSLPPVILVSQQMEHKAVALLLRLGAQDFIHVPSTSPQNLQKVIFSSIHRQSHNKNLYDQAMIDELTQLYNRRGFEHLGARQLNITKRNKSRCAFLFIDLDNLKVINDTFGHEVGDKAICEVAGLLRSTFRSTDIIARLGGDEFVVLAPEIDKERADSILLRLRSEFDKLNRMSSRVYRLSASIGVVDHDHNSSMSLSQLQHQACKLMYAEKRGKKGTR
jgi:diguanylate cyclase (GGDEF)-like protein